MSRLHAERECLTVLADDVQWRVVRIASAGFLLRGIDSRQGCQQLHDVLVGEQEFRVGVEVVGNPADFGLPGCRSNTHPGRYFL